MPLNPLIPFLSLNWWDGVSVLEFRQHGDLHPEKAPVFAFKHLFLTAKGVDAQPI